MSAIRSARPTGGRSTGRREHRPFTQYRVPCRAFCLCAACYQRQRKTGTTDYQRWGRRNTCSVGGCASPAKALGLCGTHRQRLRRHGHVEETRPDDWGAKHKHPMFNTWAHMRRHRAAHPIDKAWENDFLQFVADVGARPSPKHKLFSADSEKPLGPQNYVWKESITQRVPGEDDKTFAARQRRVYRALKPEQFTGYDLKRYYGLSTGGRKEMLEAQNHCCAICGKQETLTLRGRRATLAVDHCHESGKVRGLLCSVCNRALGLFRDDPALLRAAASYLESHAELA